MAELVRFFVQPQPNMEALEHFASTISTHDYAQILPIMPTLCQHYVSRMEVPKLCWHNSLRPGGGGGLKEKWIYTWYRRLRGYGEGIIGCDRAGGGCAPSSTERIIFGGLIVGRKEEYQFDIFLCTLYTKTTRLCSDCGMYY